MQFKLPVCDLIGDIEDIIDVTPQLHLTAYTSFIDYYNRKGYVIDIDTSKGLVPCSARYFSSEGHGTYCERDLTPSELDNLIKHPRIATMDIWGEFHKEIS